MTKLTVITYLWGRYVIPILLSHSSGTKAQTRYNTIQRTKYKLPISQLNQPPILTTIVDIFEQGWQQSKHVFHLPKPKLAPKYNTNPYIARSGIGFGECSPIKTRIRGLDDAARWWYSEFPTGVTRRQRKPTFNDIYLESCVNIST